MTKARMNSVTPLPPTPPATPASFLFLKDTRHHLISGPLHWLFLCLEYSSSRHAYFLTSYRSFFKCHPLVQGGVEEWGKGGIQVRGRGKGEVASLNPTIWCTCRPAA